MGRTRHPSDPPAPPPMAEPADAALVLAAQRDPLAFAPLYQRYVTPIHRYCYRQTSDPDIAADLTAQIFTRALEALPRFRLATTDNSSGTTFRSWLFAIAHNAIIDHRRRAHPTNTPLTATTELRDPDVGPEDRAVHRDELARLIAVLDQLPPQHRQIVELRLAGLTTAEVADAIGTSRAAIKSAQTRAYSRLRALLAPPPITAPSLPEETTR